MVALRFTAEQPKIAAMVIRGSVGAEEIAAAGRVKAPTMLIHAERDAALSKGAHDADEKLAAPHQLLEIPESSPQFNDPVSMELMVSASVDWLVDHLGARRSLGSPTDPPTIETVGKEGTQAPRGGR